MVVAHQTDATGPHVLFYGHYDVQPVDPLELWDTDPFEPVLRPAPDGDTHIVGRGASDDKGQLLTFIEACRAWKAVTGSLPIKVSMLFEGEEESGSASLGPFLRDTAAELRADVMMVCDTDMWDRETPAITTMLRGLVGEEFTITTADRDLHSGMFGNAARNALQVAADVLSTLRSPDGGVTLPGFYDGVEDLAPEVLAQWQRLPFDQDAFLSDIGLSIPAGEAGYSIMEQVWARPSCEIHGVIGGYTDPGFKTVIPAKATAKVSFRLVAGQDPSRIREAFRAHSPRPCAIRLFGQLHCAWRKPGAVPAARQPLSGGDARGLEPGMGHRDGACGNRRINPDRGGIQATARYGHAAGWLRAVRQPHTQPEREIRSVELYRRYPILRPGACGLVRDRRPGGAMTAAGSMRAIIDTDPGLDDAVAILYALTAPDITVEAITAVAGNIGISTTTRNVGGLLAAMGQGGIPYAAGAAGPLAGDGRSEVAIHGEDGLGGVPLPPALAPPDSRTAIALMDAHLRAALPGSLCILALGPLTNLAHLAHEAPAAYRRIGRIIAMGGTINEPGNAGPFAEFNMAADPLAARVVFGGPVPVTLIPLDVTRKLRATPDDLVRLATFGTAEPPPSPPT